MHSFVLDIRTLSIITVLFSFFSGISVILYSFMQKIFKGLNMIGNGLIVLSLGFLLIGLRSHIPESMSVILGNSLVLGGLFCVNAGVCRFREIPNRCFLFCVFLLVATILAISFYQVIVPSVNYRIIAISLSLAIISWFSSWNLVKKARRRTDFPNWMTSFSFFAFGSFMLFRAVWSFAEPTIVFFMSASQVHAVAFLAVIVLSLHTSTGIIWIGNTLLQNELKKYERVISTAPDLIVLVDEKGVYKMINDAGAVMLGLRREDILGKSSADLFGKDFYHSTTLRNIEKALKGEVSMVAKWLPIGESEDKYMILHYHPVPDADGAIRQVAISGRDLTEIQKVQEERQLIFTLSLDMLCITGLDGDFREVNPAWQETLGWDKDTLLESFWIDFVHPDDVQSSLEFLQTLKRGQPVRDFVNRIKTKGGLYLYISWTSHPDLNPGLIYSVAHNVSERKRLEDELKRQASTDPLTGVCNRRVFMERGSDEIERSLRYGNPLSLLMLDIDHFKSVNDTYGHDVGDEVLIVFAEETANQLRNTDVFCRLGGEEFGIILLNADIDSATALAERIRVALSGIALEKNGKTIRFTVSIGGTSRRKEDQSLEVLLKRADESLYEAKSHGRNQVCMV